MTGDVSVTPNFRPASPAGIADGAFEVFRRAPVSFLVLSALANLPLFGAIAGLVLWVRTHGASWGSFSYFAVLALLSLAVAIAAWIRAVGTGALGHAAMRALAGGTPSTAASLGAAMRRGATLGVVCAVRLAAVLLGFAFCLLPGFLALGALALAPMLTVAEDLSVSQSITRSIHLSARAARGTFAATLLMIGLVLVGFVELLLGAQLALVLLGAVAPGVPTTFLEHPAVAWILLAVAKVIADPPVAAASAAALVDARIRAEGLDLELRSQLLAGEPLSIVPAEEPA